MGEPSIREVQARVSSREFAEWMAYEKVAGPLGPERDDILTAIVAAVTHNMWAKKPKKVDAFLPEWDRKPQTPEEQLAWVKTLNRAYGGSEGGD